MHGIGSDLPAVRITELGSWAVEARYCFLFSFICDVLPVLRRCLPIQLRIIAALLIDSTGAVDPSL